MSARPASPSLERIARGLPPVPPVSGQLAIIVPAGTGALLDAMWGPDFRAEFCDDLAACASRLAGRPVSVRFDPADDPQTPPTEEPA